MTAARCSAGWPPTRPRRPPRKATPKPMPPTTDPARKTRARVGGGGDHDQDHACGERHRSAAAPIHGACGRARAGRPRRTRPGRRRRSLETMTLVVSNRSADSCGPSEKNSPPIDHDDSTARRGEQEWAARPRRHARAAAASDAGGGARSPARASSRRRRRRPRTARTARRTGARAAPHPSSTRDARRACRGRGLRRSTTPLVRPTRPDRGAGGGRAARRWPR